MSTQTAIPYNILLENNISEYNDMLAKLHSINLDSIPTSKDKLEILVMIASIKKDILRDTKLLLEYNENMNFISSLDISLDTLNNAKIGDTLSYYREGYNYCKFAETTIMDKKSNNNFIIVSLRSKISESTISGDYNTTKTYTIIY